MRLASVLVVLGTALVACTQPGTTAPAGPSDPSTPAVDEAGAAEPPAAPEALRFSAPIVGGDDLDLATLGDRPVVFWFWSPFCSICNAEAGSVQASATELGDRADFVGVAWAGDRGHFTRFIERHGISFPTINDASGVVFDRFGIIDQPAAVVVTPDGDVRTLRDADGPAITAVLAGLT